MASKASTVMEMWIIRSASLAGPAQAPSFVSHASCSSAKKKKVSIPSIVSLKARLLAQSRRGLLLEDGPLRRSPGIAAVSVMPLLFGDDTDVTQRICSFIERVERIDEEIKALNEGKKEVFSEAKGEGFDVKVLKKSFVCASRTSPSATNRSRCSTSISRRWIARAHRKQRQRRPDRRRSFA
jgi:hypothetical protein